MKFKLFLAAILTAITASAYDFESGGIYYNILSDGTSVAVTFKDTSYNSYSGSVTVPDKVTNGSTTYNVTKIGSDAFHGCTNSISVTIPSSVTLIDSRAFLFCTGLTSMDIPNSVEKINSEAFYGCTALNSLTIGTSVSFLGDGAFSGCSGLTSVTIPPSVTELSGRVFQNCTGLTTIEIPSTVTTLAAGAFAGCSSLTSFTGPYASTDNRCLIMDGALKAFAPSGVTSYAIPSTVTSIGYSVFQGCTGLTSVEIPASVNSIGQHAFENCNTLAAITIMGTTPPTVNANSFTNVPASCSVIVPDPTALTAYEAADYWNNFTNLHTPYNTIFYTSDDGSEVEPKETDYILDASSNKLTVNSNTYVDGWGRIVFSGDIARIGTNAFYGKSKLTSVILPENLKSIGTNAFNSCGLISMVIPNSVTSIDSNAFGGCSNLTSVVLGSNMATLGSGAFYYCSKLAEVISLNTSAPSIQSNTFQNVSASCIYKVPGVAIVPYHSSWSAYVSNIQAISLALTDSEAYTVNFDFVSGTTTYTRDFPGDTWQALFLPFPMEYSDWSDKGTVAELTGVTAAGELEWTTVKSGSIAAGKPYIFKPEAAGEITFSVNGATLNACDTKTTVSYSDYTLSGTYTEKTDMATSKAYGLSGGTFYYTTSNDKVLKPYRIFLNVPADIYAKKASVRSIIDGDDVSGIDDIEIQARPENGQAYNFQGVPVAPSYRGLVIINGKKVIRK